jgi:hypothetical protein
MEYTKADVVLLGAAAAITAAQGGAKASFPEHKAFSLGIQYARRLWFI